MSRTLHYRETLVYYDGPELFVAVDQIGARYLCLSVQLSEDVDTYMSIPISLGRLALLKSGNIDLRSAFLGSETREYFLCDASAGLDQALSLRPLENNTVPESWLPQDGFYFRLSIQDGETENISDEARQRNRAIIHLHLNPPEAATESKINTDTLSQCLRIFQRLVRHCYRKTIQSVTLKNRLALDSPDHWTLRTFAFSPGSFTLHMESAAPADMHGHAEMARALRLIDKFAERFSNPDDTIQVLRENRGHLVASFRDFVEFIVDTATPVTYHWTMPELTAPITRVLPHHEAVVLRDLLRSRVELGEESIVVDGVFEKADVKSGAWRVRSDDSKDFSGRLDPDADLNLDGITLGNRRYRLHCIEHLEEDRSSGRELSELLLRNLEPLA